MKKEQFMNQIPKTPKTTMGMVFDEAKPVSMSKGMANDAIDPQDVEETFEKMMQNKPQEF